MRPKPHCVTLLAAFIGVSAGAAACVDRSSGDAGTRAGAQLPFYNTVMLPAHWGWNSQQFLEFLTVPRKSVEGAPITASFEIEISLVSRTAQPPPAFYQMFYDPTMPQRTGTPWAGYVPRPTVKDEVFKHLGPLRADGGTGAPEFNLDAPLAQLGTFITYESQLIGTLGAFSVPSFVLHEHVVTAWKHPMSEERRNAVLGFLEHGSEWMVLASLATLPEDDLPDRDEAAPKTWNVENLERLDDWLEHTDVAAWCRELAALRALPTRDEAQEAELKRREEWLRWIKFFPIGMRVCLYQGPDGEIDPALSGFENRAGTKDWGWLALHEVRFLEDPRTPIRLGTTDRVPGYVMQETRLRSDISNLRWARSRGIAPISARFTSPPFGCAGKDPDSIRAVIQQIVQQIAGAMPDLDSDKLVERWTMPLLFHEGRPNFIAHADAFEDARDRYGAKLIRALSEPLLADVVVGLNEAIRDWATEVIVLW